MCGVWEVPVRAVERWGEDYGFLRFEAPELALKCLPGQFVMAAPECSSYNFPYPLLKRALAIYEVPESGPRSGQLSLMVKAIGDGTRGLLSLREGDRLQLIGPLGNGFDLEASQGRQCLLIAGGIGLASFLLLARRLLELGREVTLLYGGRSRSDLFGLADFKRLGIPCLVTTEDGSEGLHGRVTLALEEVLQQPTHDFFSYTCGPNPMMEAVSKINLERAIPGQLSVESKMACGFGVCLGCTVLTSAGYRLACTHGPVFSVEEFVWEGNNKLGQVLLERGISC